jgi:hypothetical protein
MSVDLDCGRSSLTHHSQVSGKRLADLSGEQDNTLGEA